jgi:hypothetical protein
MMVGKNTDDNYCKILDAMDEDEAVAFVSKKVKETIESCQKLQQAVDLKKFKRRDPTKYRKRQLNPTGWPSEQQSWFYGRTAISLSR